MERPTGFSLVESFNQLIKGDEIAVWIANENHFEIMTFDPAIKSKESLENPIYNRQVFRKSVMR